MSEDIEMDTDDRVSVPRSLSARAAEAAEEADNFAGQALGILQSVPAFATSDHAIAWATLALVSEVRAMRLITAEQLGTLRDHVERLAMLQDTTPSGRRRGGGSW